MLRILLTKGCLFCYSLRRAPCRKSNTAFKMRFIFCCIDGIIDCFTVLDKVNVGDDVNTGAFKHLYGIVDIGTVVPVVVDVASGPGLSLADFVQKFPNSFFSDFVWIPQQFCTLISRRNTTSGVVPSSNLEVDRVPRIDLGFAPFD